MTDKLKLCEGAELPSGMAVVRVADVTAMRLTPKDSLLKLWEYNGTVWASGLFKLHDQVGFSLTDSLIECQRRGWKPCLNDFRAEARRAGWEPERIDRTIESAISDAKAMSTSPPPQP